MKVTKLFAAAMAAAALATVGIAGTPTASADYASVDNLGKWHRLADPNGIDVTYWKVSDIKPSTDVVPDYPLNGTLWEASATARAERGSVTPYVPNFVARSPDGTDYRAVWQYDSPNGISSARLAQGDETTGKLYFDVTGPPPNSVVYNNGIEDNLVWVP
jgi:hypothetical protein